MKTIQELANEAQSFFKTKTRIGGESYIYMENPPEWIANMTRDAHDGMLPDDHKYRFIVEALGMISGSSDESLDDLDLNIEADIYAGELTRWLASNLIRHRFCDEVLENDVGIKALDDILRQAQYAEKSEVFHSVKASLERLTVAS